MISKIFPSSDPIPHFPTAKNEKLAKVEEKLFIPTDSSEIIPGPKSLLKTTRSVAEAMSNVPSFQVKGVHYLKMVFDSAYYFLALSYTFGMDSTNETFYIRSFLPQKIISVLFLIADISYYGALHLSKVRSISSDKKDLLGFFAFSRDIAVISLCITGLYIVLRKQLDFKRIVTTFWPKVQKEEMKWGKTRIGASITTVVLHALCISGFLYLPPSPIQLGIIGAGKQYLDLFQISVLQEFPFLSFLFPNEGNWNEMIFSLILLLILFHFWLLIWYLLLCNYAFALFHRKNLESFKSYLEAFIGANHSERTNKLFDEYMELKRIIKSVNQYHSPLLTSMVLGVIPYSSFILASFSKMPAGTLIVYWIWVGLTYLAFFIAASSNAQTEEFKSSLLENKRKLEKVVKDSSDLTWMLMDMVKGNELGLTCFGCVTIDFSLIGMMISSTLTFAIILIQA